MRYLLVAAVAFAVAASAYAVSAPAPGLVAAHLSAHLRATSPAVSYGHATCYRQSFPGSAGPAYLCWAGLVNGAGVSLGGGRVAWEVVPGRAWQYVAIPAGCAPPHVCQAGGGSGALTPG